MFFGMFFGMFWMIHLNHLDDSLIGNELSGALTGLTRVRRFQQDDAHIFCAVQQIGSEVLGVLQLISDVYAIFGMTFSLCLSTRPETKIGARDTICTAATLYVR
ncbi:hypothetical protein T492DRAFT_508648 [Pavlovales sp. CCMP2436]|nr:hypothetical protein T492DRAFT_508648 [Pavlovales sp. CCMP2436]